MIEGMRSNAHSEIHELPQLIAIEQGESLALRLVVPASGVPSIRQSEFEPCCFGKTNSRGLIDLRQLLHQGPPCRPALRPIAQFKAYFGKIESVAPGGCCQQQEI